MARKFLTPIDLTGLELLNFKIQNLATAPTPKGAGHTYYDTAQKAIVVYDGSSWNLAGNVKTGLDAAKGSSSAAGSTYYATDTHLLYVGDGTGGWSQGSQFGTVALLGATASDGTSTDYARADHVHRHAGADHNSIKLTDLASPSADYSLAGFKLTNVGTPVAGTDAANKAYVDNAVVGIDWKASVRVVATSSITLSGLQSIDGVTLAAGDRVLVTAQSDATKNGIYIVASGAWSRSPDADTDAELTSAFAVFVEEGTVNADNGWVLTTNGTITIGTTALAFTQFTGLGEVTAGAGLTKSGNQIDVVSASAARIVVNPDSIDLATVAQTNPTGTAGTTFVQAVAIDSYGRVTGQTTATIADASTGAKGIASFSSTNFTVTAGAVSIKAAGVPNTALVNSSVTVTAGTGLSGGGDVALGSSITLATVQDIATTATPTFAGLTLTAPLAVASGGTGANTAAGAKTNLGFMTRFSQDIGNGTLTSIAVTHNLNTQDVTVQVYDKTSLDNVECDIVRTSANVVTIGFAVAPASNAYRVVVIG